MLNLMRMLLILFLSSVLLSCTEYEPPASQPVPSYNNDIMAYHPSQYSNAYKRFRQAAMKGDPIAQNNIGRMYADGRGVDQDSGKAVQWFTSAAKQGNVDAAMNLGVAYLYGQGVSRDQTQACSWFNKARRAGNPQGNELYRRYCV
jgi:TPR repeat protein